MNRKTVVVTGASSGIGRATAERFAVEGWAVCALARRETELDRLLGALPGGDHLKVVGDYSVPATARRLEEILQARWGRLDALINCAGVSMSGNPIDTALSEWRRALDVMLDGAVLITRATVPLLVSGSRIVHITSIHGERVERGSSAYAVAKAAINQYCRALAL